MDMPKQLQKLTDALSAGQSSQARAMLLQLFDESTFVEIDRLVKDDDKPAEVVVGYGMVDGSPSYAFAQDRNVYNGAIGKVQALKILKIYELAAQNGVPVVGIFDSDGAKLGEGVDAMDAIAEILLASNNISGVVPQIAVITGACVGSSAIIAANADIVVSVKDADYYLNPGDENAEAAVMVEDAHAALNKARDIISMLPSNNLTAPAAYDFDSLDMLSCENIDGVIEAVADNGTAIVLGRGSNQTAFARVGGIVCGMVGLSQEKISREEASRIARFVRLCDGFTLPVITFVDSAGFESLEGAAKLSHAYAEATTAKITVIVGKAYGSAYIAAAGKSAGSDIVLAWPTAVILPLAPIAAIHIFWKDRLGDMTNPTQDREKLAEEFAEEQGDALTAAAKGVVSDVIPPSETKSRIVSTLEMLSGKRVSRLPKKHSNIVL
ncbi:MAG: carboxyl transferase domain-containing protein [Oscillospiraceae bacterium]|nr:carboxyl transferase domain-containing protein [Oscillospiraceae bacterium]MDD3832309.1 carboxyl transferase domain-containing protein [Oscillospiraceae bacterium]MDD4546084.1 carboxyl transferase domain-containing protein [Oscillospiraceae bacterium]